MLMKGIFLCRNPFSIREDDDVTSIGVKLKEAMVRLWIVGFLLCLLSD